MRPMGTRFLKKRIRNAQYDTSLGWQLINEEGMVPVLHRKVRTDVPSERYLPYSGSSYHGECKTTLRVLGYHGATRRLGSFALATMPISKLVRIIADTPILTIAEQGRAGKAVSAVE